MFGIEIKPYIKHIKVFKESNAVPNRETLEKMRDIYDEHIRDPRLAKTSLGCGNCVKHMMNQLAGAVDRLGNEPIKLEPKIPHLKPSELIEEDFHELYEDIDSLKWGEFKKYCKESGLSVKGKTRKELMKELGC